VQIGNIYSTKSSTATDITVLVNGGEVYVANGMMRGEETRKVLVTSGIYSQRNGEMGSDALGVISAEATGGTLDLSGVLFSSGAGALTEPHVIQSGTGILKLANCSARGVSVVSEIVRIGADNAGNFVDSESLAPNTTTLPATVVNGIYKVPRAVQNASVAFATPGTSSFTYGARAIYWKLDGDFTHVNFRLVFTPTLGTASGALSITGITIPASGVATEIPVAQWQGVTLTGGRTALVLRKAAGATTFDLLEVGGGAAPRVCDVTNFTTGTQVQILTSGAVLMRVA
jgi:hypothetical protein